MTAAVSLPSGPYVAVSGARVTSGSLTLHYFGRWVADLTIATPDPVPSLCTVTMGQLSMAAYVVRSAPFAGARAARIAAGFGGWGNTLPRKAYAFSGGVSLSTVLGDAAIECGEKVNVVPDSSLGAAWTRPTQTGAELLRQLAGVLWWIDPAGVTHVSPVRPSPTITSDFTVINAEPGAGQYEIATETLQDWAPGAIFASQTVTGNVSISSVTFRVDNSGTLRVHVLGQGAQNQ